ncbi:MAG: lysostaphin resistance A-like protein [Methanobacterium sp.]
MFVYATMAFQTGNANFLDIQNQLNALILNPIVLTFVTVIMYVFSLIIFYLCARFIHKRKFISFINLNSKLSWVKILKGSGLWFAILGGFTLISVLLSPGAYNYTFQPSAFAILLLIVIIGIPIQASFEEIFFRGYLMQGVGKLTKKPIIPLLVTSVLFAILHGANGISDLVNIFIVIQILVIGLMLGIIVLGENRIETAMGIHIANNIFAFLVVSSSDEVVSGVPSILTAPQSTPMDLYIGLLTTVIAALIVLTVVFWGKKDKLIDIFRWKDAENREI